MTKLLATKYKTYEGARKRAGFENGIAGFEFKQGYKARLYAYRVVTDTEGNFRVERRVEPKEQRPHVVADGPSQPSSGR